MRYLQVALNTTNKSASYYENILFSIGALSITFIDSQDNPIFEPEIGFTPLWNFTTILALFDLNDKEEVLSYLKLLSIENNIVFENQELQEKNWEREWLKYFKPISFRKRLYILPTGFEEKKNKINLRLDPGLAFGTGTHSTTFLCLSYLDENQFLVESVLDFGCGSGILSIASLLLGASRVVSVDIDEQALIATKQNAIKNNIDLNSIHITSSDVNEEFDLVLANILAQPLIELSEKLKSFVKKDGQIVLSGILEEQTENVLSFYNDSFDFEIKEKDGWVCCIGCRK